MNTTGMSVVTGAFGYTGRYIAEQLISMGKPGKTLTGHTNRPNPFPRQISVAPYNFDNPAELRESLEGAETLYNTYWIRFERGHVTFDQAVENTLTLIRAAKEAGVRRLVHISITNASSDSPLPYFRGKGLVEGAIKSSGLSYAIIRPTVIFGKEDILINNIAWFLRRLPVFTIFGSGEYQVQPVFVEDVAEIAVEAAQQRDNVTIDAAGPERVTFEDMVRLIGDTIGARVRLVHIAPAAAFLLGRVIGLLVRDVVLTRDEIKGLVAELLVAAPGSTPTGHTRLSDWLEENAGGLGSRYASELDRHYR